MQEELICLVKIYSRELIREYNSLLQNKRVLQ